MPIVTAIQFWRGEAIHINVTMTPVTDITGWTFAFTVRQRYGDPGSPVLQKTSAGGGIMITSAGAGQFQVTLVSSDTSALTPEGYVYDIWRVDTGAESVLCVGDLKLNPEVRF